MINIFTTKTKLRILFFSSILIGIVLISLFLVKVGYEKFKKIEGGAVVVNFFAPEEITPEYFYFSKNPNKKLNVLAEAYLVGDLETGQIILAKNQKSKFAIASVSKLMSGVISQEFQNQEDTTKISKKVLATEGENGNLRLNEKIKVGDLLYPLLLESSNDAAEALAAHSVRTFFIEKMNEKAKDLGLVSTSFADPSGLSPKNQSTTTDLFKLTQYIKEKLPNLFEITTKQSYKNQKHVWFSNNQFLKADGYIGGKSGYIDESRQTVVSLFSLPLGQSSSRHISITLLRSPDRYKDVENILKYLKSNIYYGQESDAGASWVKSKTEIEEIANPDFVTLAFLGDTMLDRGVKSSVNRNFGGDYSILFENLGILKKTDIVFANLEGGASDKGRDAGSLYSFRMDPSVIPALRGAGISILSVANNHMGDWGRIAYIDTLSRLKENEILYTGGGVNIEEAERPVVIEKHGIKIGYLGFSDKGPAWLEAGKDMAGLLLADNPRFDEIIINASLEVDHLIVSFHFGEEYQKKHDARQELLAHRAVDNGAKIVIGHHPHVMQDTEVYKNSFIAYSLGNFIFDQGFSKDTMEGMLLELKLGRDGSMTVKKNVVKLNKVFKPNQIIKGKEEKIKFQ